LTDKRRFRYADLQLQNLLERSLLLDTDIDQTLSAIPPTLNETYDNILRKINPSHWRLARRALRWIVVADRLSVPWLGGAVVLGPWPPLPEEVDVHWWVRRPPGLSSVETVVLLRHLVVFENPRNRTAAGLTSTAACNEDNEGRLVFAHFSVMEYLTTPEYMASELRPTFAIGRVNTLTKAGSIVFYHLFGVMGMAAWREYNPFQG
jgi:hypothetical protein